MCAKRYHDQHQRVESVDWVEDGETDKDRVNYNCASLKTKFAPKGMFIFNVAAAMAVAVVLVTS